MAEGLQKFDPDDIDAIREARKTPEDPKSQQVLIKYKSLTEPRYEGNQLVTPKFEPLDEALFASTESEGSSFGEKASTLAKGAVGATVGVAEAVNPLSLPRAIETGVRAFGEEADPEKSLLGRVGERLQKADEKSVLPRLNIDQLAAGTRTAARVAGEVGTGSIPDVTTIFKEEMKSQEDFNENFLPEGSKQIGELGAGVVALGSLAKDAPKVFKAAQGLSGKALEKMAALRGLKAVGSESVLNLGKNFKNKGREVLGIALEDAKLVERPKDQLQKANELASQLLGDVAPEVGEAMFKRTERVEELLRSNRDARSLLPEVEKLREDIQGSRDLAGEMIGHFKDFIRRDKDTIINTRGSVQRLGQVRNELALSSGESTMTRGDLRLLEEYQKILKAPVKGPRAVGSYERSASDVMKIIDKLDADLQGYYNGNLGDNVSRTFMSKLADVRGVLKDELHTMYPAYAEADNLFSLQKEAGEAIVKKIDGLGAESFVSNLFGANKTEVRNQLESLIALNKRTAESIKKLPLNAKSGSRDLNTAANQITKTFREAAKKTNFQDAQAFLNDVADKVAARQLNQVSNSGLSDFPADRIRRLTDDYVKNAVTLAQSRAGKAAGSALAPVGAAGGSLLGFFMTSAGGPLAQMSGAITVGGAGAAGAYAAGSKMAGGLAGLLAKANAEKQAKELFSPFKLLEYIKKAKSVDPKVKQVADDILFVQKELGTDSAALFMNIIPMTPKMKSALEKAIAAETSAKGIMGVIQQKGERE